MWDDIRVQQLADNIRQDLDLLKDYEDELQYASDPRMMAKYRREIKRQRESLARNQHEYDELMKSAQDVIESHPVPEKELQDTLNAMQQILSEIRHSKAGQYSPQLVSEVEKVSGIIADPKLDANHKLKYSIPIIPLILSYEGEVELKSGLNLKKVWQGLIAKLHSDKKKSTRNLHREKLRNSLKMRSLIILLILVLLIIIFIYYLFYPSIKSEVSVDDYAFPPWITNSKVAQDPAKDKSIKWDYEIDCKNQRLCYATINLDFEKEYDISNYIGITFAVKGKKSINEINSENTPLLEFVMHTNKDREGISSISTYTYAKGLCIPFFAKFSIFTLFCPADSFFNLCFNRILFSSANFLSVRVRRNTGDTLFTGTDFATIGS